jgi:hypothetical protein
MSAISLMVQVEACLAHPVLQQRRPLYTLLVTLFVQHVQPIEAFGLMLRDCTGQPMVGPLEQMVRSVVLPEASPLPLTAMNPLLVKLLGDQQLLQRCRDQLLARQAIRCINQAIQQLVDLHERRRIFLNREDLQRLSELYALLDYAVLASSFDLRPFERLFHQPHPEMVAVQSLLA